MVGRIIPEEKEVLFYGNIRIPIFGKEIKGTKESPSKVHDVEEEFYVTGF